MEAVAIILVILAVLWVILPLILLGTNKRLDTIIELLEQGKRSSAPETIKEADIAFEVFDYVQKHGADNKQNLADLLGVSEEQVEKQSKGLFEAKKLTMDQYKIIIGELKE
jgi:hypothetical protein